MIDTPSTPPSAKDALLAQHRQAAASPVEKGAQIIDHLVDAMAGDPSAPLRRVLILIDIAMNPGTSQNGVIERTDSDKSTVARDIDWLYNYGCITKKTSENNAREVSLTICGFAKTHMGYAAKLTGDDLSRLKKFIEDYITIFLGYKPTLRDAKIITVMTLKNEASRGELLDELYNGPSTTENRALAALVEHGYLKSTEEENDNG